MNFFAIFYDSFNNQKKTAVSSDIVCLIKVRHTSAGIRVADRGAECTQILNFGPRLRADPRPRSSDSRYFHYDKFGGKQEDYVIWILKHIFVMEREQEKFPTCHKQWFI